MPRTRHSSAPARLGPTDLRHLANVALLRRAAGRIGELHLPAFAAALAYGAVFAMVPMLVLVVLAFGLLQAEGLVLRAVDEIGGVLPPAIVDLVEEQLLLLVDGNRLGSLGIGAVVTVVIALWGASGAMRRVMEALTVVHAGEEGRSLVHRMLLSVVLAIGAAIVLASTLVVIVVGGDVATWAFELVGAEGAATAWGVARWPVAVVIAWLGIVSAFRWAPASRRTRGIATPGILLATLSWIVFSVAFSWYLGTLGSLDAWGPVAGIIALLLYVQYTGLIMLLAALLDVELADHVRRVA
jgi:membrane protein